ncbi:MAG TPA: ABC transporter permease [Flavisolibacter sp.]|jgi:lipopolysaccharide transport system permease protein|nr:ABC transporter permease [Flavisolibacter sp.]
MPVPVRQDISIEDGGSIWTVCIFIFLRINFIIMYQQNSIKENEKWSLVIRPKTSLLALNLQDLWRYRDLLVLFVKRDFKAMYKQTVLGPLWFLIQPLLSTFMFVIIFDRVAGIPTAGIPSSVFYLSGLVLWNYFAACLNNTAVTFTANSNIFGKVYFPRMIAPMSNVITALVSFGIQFGILLVFILYHAVFSAMPVQMGGYLLILPFVLLLVAFLGLGLGLIVSSLTAKYRDLVHLIGFGVQLLMYATPVIYPLSFVEGKYKLFILANPISPLIEVFRFALLGVGELRPGYLLYSSCVVFFILFTGIVVFNKVEKNFIDTI